MNHKGSERGEPQRLQMNHQELQTKWTSKAQKEVNHNSSKQGKLQGLQLQTKWTSKAQKEVNHNSSKQGKLQGLRMSYKELPTKWTTKVLKYLQASQWPILSIWTFLWAHCNQIWVYMGSFSFQIHTIYTCQNWWKNIKQLFLHILSSRYQSF